VQGSDLASLVDILPPRLLCGVDVDCMASWHLRLELRHQVRDDGIKLRQLPRRARFDFNCRLSVLPTWGGGRNREWRGVIRAMAAGGRPKCAGKTDQCQLPRAQDFRTRSRRDM